MTAAGPNLVFIGCAPGRSGADTLQRLLLLHPHAARLGERDVLLLDAIADLVPAVEDGDGYLPRMAAVAFREFAAAMDRRLGDGTTARALSRLGASTTDGEIFVPAYGTLPLARPLSRETWLAHLREFVHEVAGAQERPPPRIVCDKLSANMLHGRLAAELCPCARVVVVIRDPLASALSLTRSDVAGVPAPEAAEFVRRYYERWLDVAPSTPERGRIVVRFEDLIDDPAGELTALASSIGLADDGAWTTEAEATIGPIEDPIEGATPADLEVCLARLTGLSEKLGYAA